MPKKNWKGESGGQNFTEQSPATRGETLRVRFQGRLEEGRRRGDRRVEDPRWGPGGCRSPKREARGTSRQWEMGTGRGSRRGSLGREQRGNSKRTQTPAYTWRAQPRGPKPTLCGNLYSKIQTCVLHNLVIAFKQINLLNTKIGHKT